LHPEAVGEVEKSYSTPSADVKRLHREICSLNQRAAARPAPSVLVAEGGQKATTTMVAYSSTLVHTVEMDFGCDQSAHQSVALGSLGLYSALGTFSCDSVLQLPRRPAGEVAPPCAHSFHRHLESYPDTAAPHPDQPFQRPHVAQPLRSIAPSESTAPHAAPRCRCRCP
jgi:hypothetical protein